MRQQRINAWLSQDIIKGEASEILLIAWLLQLVAFIFDIIWYFGRGKVSILKQRFHSQKIKDWILSSCGWYVLEYQWLNVQCVMLKGVNYKQILLYKALKCCAGHWFLFFLVHLLHCCHSHIHFVHLISSGSGTDLFKTRWTFIWSSENCLCFYYFGAQPLLSSMRH